MSLYRSRQRKKDARSGEILNAALKVFLEKGFRAARVEDIACAAGVTKGTPYLYYQNKEALFKAVVQDRLGASQAKMLELTHRHAGSSKELLSKIVDVWWSEVGTTEAAGIFKLMIVETAKFPELASYYNEMIIQPARVMTATILQKGIDSGEFRPVSIALAIDVLIVPILMAMLWQHSFSSIPGLAGNKNDPQRQLRLNLDIIISGLSMNYHD